MHDLGTLPGDAASVGLGINVSGEVVGLSLDASGNPRAFLRQNGVMTDLETLIPADSPFLALFVADIINSSGEIAGFGLTNSFEVHGFLATPIKSGGGSGLPAPVAAHSTSHEKATLPESVRKMIWQKMRNGRFALQPVVAQ
jgi:probable HAF family extracellular repeat protein